MKASSASLIIKRKYKANLDPVRVSRLPHTTSLKIKEYLYD